MIYARVSSSENKAELDAQVERSRQYALAKGYRIREVVKEIGSGINDNRKRLQKLLRDGKATRASPLLRNISSSCRRSSTRYGTIKSSSDASFPRNGMGDKEFTGGALQEVRGKAGFSHREIASKKG